MQKGTPPVLLLCYSLFPTIDDLVASSEFLLVGLI
jgi:hypothetical protein